MKATGQRCDSSSTERGTTADGEVWRSSAARWAVVAQVSWRWEKTPGWADSKCKAALGWREIAPAREKGKKALQRLG
jgi:hypothetical protein